MSDITNPEATEERPERPESTLSLPVAGTFLLAEAEGDAPALVLVLMADGTVRWITATPEEGEAQ